MAYTKHNLTSSAWTLIGNNVDTITFQNIGQNPIYINFTSANSAPSDTVGIVYDIWQGELKKTLTDLTLISTPKYVWGKTVSHSGSVVVET